MKCLYICIITVSVISAAIPEDICDTCVPTQDCPLFETLGYEDQLTWMERFPCGSLPKTNDFEVPAGFASAAKGDYVCCSNNIWGLEKPENYRPNYGQHLWNKQNKTDDNSIYNSDLDDKSKLDSNNERNETDSHSQILFPDWNDDYGDRMYTNRPNDDNYKENEGLKGDINNPNTNVNNTNDFEVFDGSSTVWFPNRTHNSMNTDYWLTHKPDDRRFDSTPRNNWQDKPDQEWMKERPKAPSENDRNRNTPTPYPIYFSPGNTAGPFYRTPAPPRNNGRGRYNNPPYNYVQPPYNPPNRYIPGQNQYYRPWQPAVNTQWPYYNNQGRRNDNVYTHNPYTQTPVNSIGPSNFGGQCARLTSFPPDPQTNCCGRQLADSDRITGRPLYNQPAFTNNYWARGAYGRAPVWNTRDEVTLNSTDQEVKIERRISGGHATELYQYPWTVLLLTTFNYGNREAAFNCGGSLISARYVLTAGHCVYDKGATVKSVQVNLAEYDKRTFPKDCKTTRNGRQCIENIMMYAEHIVTHPQYQNENLINDIALLRLKGTAPYTEYIRPICLPSFNIDEPQFSNLQFEVAGWGRNGPYSSDVKQSTYLHLMNHQQCKRYYPQLTDKHMCASGNKGADTCKGDSGGPLMVLYRGRYYVAGIVSGKRADSPCGTSVPSLYTNVYHYVDWIRRNIRN